MSSEETTDRLCWVDIETTALHDTADILELGAIVTDGDLKPLASIHLLFGVDVDELQMTEWAWKTHTENGLLEELRQRSGDIFSMRPTVMGSPLGDIQESRITTGLISLTNGIRSFSDFTWEHSPGAPMAGSSVHFDRKMLARHFRFDPKLHYRNFDVSTFREALRRWRPDVELPPKSERHRVFDDLFASIETAKLARSLFTSHHQEPT